MTFKIWNKTKSRFATTEEIDSILDNIFHMSYGGNVGQGTIEIYLNCEFTDKFEIIDPKQG